MRPRPPLTLIGKVSHCGENIGARDGEQGRVRLGREGLAAAHGRVSEHDMWPRRRAPLLWWSGTEEDYRGDRVRRGEVRRSRVSGDDQGGPGDLRGELGEPRRSLLYRSRLKTRLPGHRRRARTLSGAAGENDAPALLGEHPGDAGEPLHRPLPRTVEGADVDDNRPGNLHGSQWTGDRHLVRIARHTERLYEPDPPPPLQDPVQIGRAHV